MGLIDGEPMHYTEIASGGFNQMMQSAFLKSHKLASEYNQVVEVIASIKIYPPDMRVPNSGNLAFSVQLKEPKYVSQKFTTALVGGMPVKTGRDMADAEQYGLFDSPQIIAGTNTIPEVVDADKVSGQSGKIDASE